MSVVLTASVPAVCSIYLECWMFRWATSSMTCRTISSQRSPAQVQVSGLAEEPEPYDPDPMAKRETLELVRAYYKITDPQVRKRLFEMTKALGAAAEKVS